MATQQPLSARGLSRTVLTPPDILGERMQLEQLGLRQDALRASQMAKMPQAKRFEYEGIDRYGDLFSSAYQSVDDQLRRYAEEHAYELSPENPQYNPELRRRFDITKRNAMEAGALMNRANKTFFEDYETLDDRNKSLSGALAYMSDSAGLGKNFKLDFETGQVGFQVGEELIPYNEVEQITNPRAFYYRPTDWREDILENVKPVYADVETEDQTVKQGILERVSNQIDNNFLYSDDADDFKYSVLKSYFENNKGVPRPSDEIIKTIIAEEEYTNPITGETVTLEDALKWGKEQALDLVKNQMGYTKRLPGDGGGFEINFGDAKKKFGGSIGQRSKTYFDGFDFFDVENEDAPLQWREEEHDVYTPRPGSIKMNIADGNVTVRADVRDIVKIKDDVLAVTYMYSPTRGVYNNDTIYLRKGDPEYESLKSGMEGYDPFQFINDWKSKTKGESVDSEKPKRGELD